jgi:hypothetical protein
MVGFVNHRELTDAYDEGRFLDGCSFRKAPSAAQVSVANWWIDLSMMPGNPLPNYYAASPLVASVLDGWRGIYHGDNVSPASKHLTEICLITPSAAFVGEFRLLDYLLFYPFVDLDDLDTQTMDNSVTLPRYTDGAGVKVMIVAVAPTVGGGTFTFDYINQAGVAKTAPTQSYSVAVANIGSIVTSEPASAAGGRIFARLAEGDTGVQSITSWTNLSSNGGLAAVVLVKPLTHPLPIAEVSVPVEREYPQHNEALPQIIDGAYLGLIVKCAASIASTTLTGRCEYVWSE